MAHTLDGRSNVYILNIYNSMIISKLDWSRKRYNSHKVLRLRYIIPSCQIEIDDNCDNSTKKQYIQWSAQYSMLLIDQVKKNITCDTEVPAILKKTAV